MFEEDMQTVNVFDVLFDDDSLSMWATYYCLNHGDDKFLRNYINTPEDAFLYCSRVRGTEELRKIAEEEYNLNNQYEFI